MLLALLLALPVWQKRVQAAKVKGWVMVPKESFKATYQQFKPPIDSLTKAGYEFHYFNPGFAKSNIRQILLNAKDSLKTALPPPNTPLSINYWNLIKQLDSKVASTLPVYIFTLNQANYFTGSKPQVALNLKWQTYSPADSVSTFIEDAWFTNAGDIRVVQGNSKPSGITYTYSNIKADDGENANFTLNTSNGRAQISIPNSKQQPFTVDTATQSIIIYADNNRVDANYLKAALQAVTQFSQRKFSLKSVNSPGLVPANTTWLFWLSEKGFGNSISNRCQNVFTYQKGRPNNVNSWMSNGGKFTTALADDEKVTLFKLINAPGSNTTSVWKDGFGNPVLNLQQQGQTNIYQFYSRFNPAWNDLVWSDSFPAWLLKLMMKPAADHTLRYDKRVLSEQQYLPEIISEQHTVAAAKSVENKSLTRYFWLALLIVFAAERWLAHRTLKTTTT